MSNSVRGQRKSARIRGERSMRDTWRMVAFEYFGTSVNEAHVFHLGEVTIFAAELEYTAARFAWELIDENPQVGISVTAGMTFERMNSLIERLIEKRLPSDSGTARHYRSASDLAVKALRDRNRLLHGHWTHSFGSPGESDVITRTRKARSRPA